MRSMCAPSALVGAWVVFLALWTKPVSAADNPPRYDLPLGRTLSYSQEMKSQALNGLPRAEIRVTFQAIVVAANPNGSSRIVLRKTTTGWRNFENSSVALFDVSPDGRAKIVGRPNLALSADSVFPLLSPDAVTATWAGPTDWTGAVMTYTSASSELGGEFVFTAVCAEGVIHHLDGVTQKLTFHFDKRRGVVVASECDSSQSHPFQRTTLSRQTLDKDERIDPKRAAALGAAYGKLFEAESKRAETLSRIRSDPTQAAKLIDEAKTILTTGMSGMDEPEVVLEFERRIKDHEQRAQGLLDDAERLAEVLNKPAPDWEAKDLEGKAWSRERLKGKVVVMDFRSRYSGLLNLSQVRRLASECKGRPVVVLGMNVDRDEEDVHYVTKAMSLDYPQIRAEDLLERFKVENSSTRIGLEVIPTLIVVDQAGVVRDSHVGYDAELRDKVMKRVEELLAKESKT